MEEGVKFADACVMQLVVREYFTSGMVRGISNRRVKESRNGVWAQGGGVMWWVVWDVEWGRVRKVRWWCRLGNFQDLVISWGW